MKFIVVGGIALIVFLFFRSWYRQKKTNKKNGELIAAAVIGWVSALADDGITTYDVTESYHGSFLLLKAKLLDRTWSEYPELNDEKVRMFIKLLTKHLQKKALEGGSTTLQTDWSAQPPLLTICREAGMGPNEFPSKAVMQIDFNNQTVMCRVVPDDWQYIYPIPEDDTD